MRLTNTKSLLMAKSWVSAAARVLNMDAEPIILERESDCWLFRWPPNSILGYMETILVVGVRLKTDRMAAFASTSDSSNDALETHDNGEFEDGEEVVTSVLARHIRDIQGLKRFQEMKV